MLTGGMYIILLQCNYKKFSFLFFQFAFISDLLKSYHLFLYPNNAVRVTCNQQARKAIDINGLSKFFMFI